MSESHGCLLSARGGAALDITVNQVVLQPEYEYNMNLLLHTRKIEFKIKKNNNQNKSNINKNFMPVTFDLNFNSTPIPPANNTVRNKNNNKPIE